MKFMLYIHRCHYSPHPCACIYCCLPPGELESNRLRESQVDYRRKSIVQKHQRIWKFFQSRKASNIVASVGMVALLGTLFVGHSQDTQIKRAQPQPRPAIDCAVCATFQFQLTANTSPYHRVRPPHIAVRKVIAHPMLRTALPASNTPATPTVNSPTQSKPTAHPPAHTGTPTPVPSGPNPGVNVFPYPSCTWWADQRY
jgi:hypothetical protein